jgi:hypothetical protein
LRFSSSSSVPWQNADAAFTLEEKEGERKKEGRNTQLQSMLQNVKGSLRKYSTTSSLEEWGGDGMTNTEVVLAAKGWRGGGGCCVLPCTSVKNVFSMKWSAATCPPPKDEKIRKRKIKMVSRTKSAQLLGSEANRREKQLRFLLFHSYFSPTFGAACWPRHHLKRVFSNRYFS